MLLPKHAWLFSLVAAILFVSHSAASQTKSTPVADFKRIYFKTNPLPILQGPIPFVSEYRLGLEFVGSNRLSYQFMGSYMNKSPFFAASIFPDTARSQAKLYEFPGYRVQAEVKYYFLKFKSDKTIDRALNPSGMYVSGHFSYASATLKAKRFPVPNTEWTNLTFTARFGMQLIYRDDFGLDGFFGLGYKRNEIFETDYRGNRTKVPLDEFVQDALGRYLASPFKISLGFNFALGLI